MNVSTKTGEGTVAISFGGKGNYDYEVSGDLKANKNVENVKIVEK